VVSLRLPAKVVDFVYFSYAWKWCSDGDMLEMRMEVVLYAIASSSTMPTFPAPASLLLNIADPGLLLHKHPNLHCFLMYHILMIGPKDVDRHP
jgi:hypothetical protein